MRILAPLLIATALLAAERSQVTVGQWNGMLVVTAPAGDGLERLGGRLAQRITLDARDQALTETAEFLRQATGLNIVVAPELIAQPPSITLQVKDMALGSVFTWIARTAAVHVGYVNEAVYIAAAPVAGAASTRLYDVSDLALPIRHFPGPSLTIPAPGGTGSGLIAPIEAPAEEGRYDLDALADLIDKVVNGHK